jgi:hypothetical protein
VNNKQLKSNNMNKNPKNAGRKKKFKVPAVQKLVLIPKCKLKDFKIMYEDLTEEYLNKKEDEKNN